MNKYLEMKTYLEQRISELKARSLALSADGRQDESVFAKIEMNVYDAFTAVLNAAEKTGGGEKFFLDKLTQIPGSWRTALTKAEAHGDEGKAHIERIKLAAAEEIRAAFMRLTEDRA